MRCVFWMKQCGLRCWWRFLGVQRSLLVCRSLQGEQEQRPSQKSRLLCFCCYRCICLFFSPRSWIIIGMTLRLELEMLENECWTKNIEQGHTRRNKIGALFGQKCFIWQDEGWWWWVRVCVSVWLGLMNTDTELFNVFHMLELNWRRMYVLHMRTHTHTRTDLSYSVCLHIIINSMD